MVSSTVTENGAMSPETKSIAAVGVPTGEYRLVGWDMDATGRKLIDEICQIAAYTPSSTYAQHVMPYRNLNPPAIKRHNMKVVTIGKYRMLKNSKTNKVLKTKSEVSALTDFLSWLESIRGDATDGVILVYHEQRKVIPAMLLEALQKYDLLKRFREIVKGFANGYNVAEAKCADTIHIYSLRTLSKTLLDKEEPLDSAVDRARLALQIVQHLSTEQSSKSGEKTGSGDGDDAMKATVEFVREFVQPTHVEEKEHAELKVIFERQNSLKPIFGALSRVNRKERQHASPLRRLLAEAGIEYSQLQEAWSDSKKEGLEKLVKEKLIAAEEKKVEDLLLVLENHFDPDKKPKISRIEQDKKSIKKELSDDKQNNNKCDSGTESPDTTTSISPVKIKPENPENEEIMAEV